VAILVGLIIVGGIVAIVSQQARGQVEVLNEPTEAREARPLTTVDDPRFDPLPIEQEEHDK